MKKNSFRLALLLCAFFLLIVGYNRLKVNTTVALDNTEEGRQHLAFENANPDLPITVLSASYIKFSLNELMERATLVIHARTVEKTKSFIVENIADNAQSVFTDYHFEILEVFRGIVDTDIVTVRLEGGATSERVVLNNSAPSFTLNDEYILFLTIPDGGWFDTPGDYYYLIGGTQGVFRGRTQNSTAYYDNSLIDFVLADFCKDIESVNNEIPVPTIESLMNERVEALKGNVARGVLKMTDEELEEWINEIKSAPQSPARVIK